MESHVWDQPRSYFLAEGETAVLGVERERGSEVGDEPEDYSGCYAKRC